MESFHVSKVQDVLNIKYVYVTNAMKRQEVEIIYFPTEVMLAYFFTKPLQGNLFRKFVVVILVHAPVSTLRQIDEKSLKECDEAHTENNHSSNDNS